MQSFFQENRKIFKSPESSEPVNELKDFDSSRKAIVLAARAGIAWAIPSTLPNASLETVVEGTSTARVIIDEAYMRSEPINGKILSKLARGTVIKIISKSDKFPDWLRVKLSDNTTGWMRNNQFSIIEPPKMGEAGYHGSVIVVDGAYMRDAPVNGNVVRMVPKGRTFTVIAVDAKSPDWFKVNFGPGATGWMRNDQFSSVEASGINYLDFYKEFMPGEIAKIDVAMANVINPLINRTCDDFRKEYKQEPSSGTLPPIVLEKQRAKSNTGGIKGLNYDFFFNTAASNWLYPQLLGYLLTEETVNEFKGQIKKLDPLLYKKLSKYNIVVNEGLFIVLQMCK